MLRIHFIGCGKLGKALAKLIHVNQAGEIQGIVNATIASSKNAVQFIGAGTPYQSVAELPAADIIFITTPDDRIQSISQQLTDTKAISQHPIIVHCSGMLASNVLLATKQIGYKIASVHPIKSFADPEAACKSFKNTYCTIEGNTETFPTLEKLFTAIGGNIIQIDSSEKQLYHSALVMANNYMVTLHHHATKSLITAGINAVIAKTIASNLMLDAYNNINAFNHQTALTGPIQRGDLQTIAGHMQALENLKQTQDIYATLGVGTLELTKHTPEIIDELKKQLIAS